MIQKLVLFVDVLQLLVIVQLQAMLAMDQFRQPLQVVQQLQVTVQ